MSNLEPFLKIGETLATFQSDGAHSLIVTYYSNNLSLNSMLKGVCLLACTGLTYTRRAKQVVSSERESCELLKTHTLFIGRQLECHFALGAVEATGHVCGLLLT